MRFFDLQADARTRSRQLSWAFALAVTGTVAGMNLALTLPWVLLHLLTGRFVDYPLGFMPVNIGVALMLVLGGWWLESGNCRHGVRLAEKLGARRAQPASRFDEQRLVNVVSEICIAAHMPAPAVMVLPGHEGINAFATGDAPGNWAITVTDGALQRLTRDELQGLLAHECSHLKEGDTALNMRLIGMVAGLEMVWGFGRSLIPEWPDEDGDASADRWRHPQAAGPTPLGLPGLVFGSLIMAVGWLGWLAGHLLQAAVSREREYLADARAVQWTRQADGLGGTLRKILAQQEMAPTGRRHAAGPALARLAAHLFLTPDDGRWPSPEHPGRLGRLIATHPPLSERIRRIYGRPRGPLPLPQIDPRTGQPLPEQKPFRW